MTSPSSRTRRRTPLALAAGLLTLLAVFAPASPVSAHDQLVSTDPSAGSVLDALPAEITLSFNAELLGDGGSNIIEVSDAAGNELADGAVAVDGTNVTQALAGAASGPITVLWRVVSSDGHPISGEFAFTVEEPAPTAGPGETTATETPEPTMTTMTTPAEPAESTEPTASPAPESEASAPGPLPWIVGVIVLLAVIGVVLYLLVLRPRGRTDDGVTGSGPSTGD